MVSLRSTNRCSFTGSPPPSFTGTNTVKFNSNQTYRRERSNSAPAWEDGTLSVSGSTLTCRVTSCSDITRINTLTAIAYGISGSTLTLTWTEQGGPQPLSGSGAGFGTVVLERIAPQAMGGTGTFDLGAGGVNWTLRAPMDQIAAAYTPAGPFAETFEAHSGGGHGGSPFGGVEATLHGRKLLVSRQTNLRWAQGLSPSAAADQKLRMP